MFSSREFSLLGYWRLKPQLQRQNLPTQVEEFLVIAVGCGGRICFSSREFHLPGLTEKDEGLSLSIV